MINFISRLKLIHKAINIATNVVEYTLVRKPSPNIYGKSNCDSITSHPFGHRLRLD